MELITGENDKGRRLDRILRKALPDHPLPLIHRLLRQKLVLINGKPGKAQDRIENGVTITISSIEDVNFAKRNNKKNKVDKNCNKNTPSNNKINYLTKNNYTLEDLILWQDDNLLAVNKPKGIAVHGNNSMEGLVQDYLMEKIQKSLSFKSGPLHRLDKPSSGIVVFSKSLEGARFFSSLIHDRKIKKTYLAIVEGRIDKEEIWQDELFRDTDKKKTLIVTSNVSGEPLKSCGNAQHSKNAVTKIFPLAFTNDFSLIKAEIITGRTHQIRSQAAFHKHPLAGDVKYGGKILRLYAEKPEKKNTKIKNEKNTADFFLHAWKLEFPEHSLTAPLPEDFLLTVEKIFGKEAGNFVAGADILIQYKGE